MKIAVITGASAGLGKEFLGLISEYYPEIEEYWLIARNKEKLEAAASLANRPCRIIPGDLTLDESYDMLESEAKTLSPEVKLLINNAGCGYLGNVGEGKREEQTRTVDLNLRGLVAVTHIFIPYMTKGAKIINISSIASFCPNPRMTVYSSSKAFVTAFSIGIGEELRERGITSTAVCPGPMDTEFICLGGIKGNSKMFEILPYCDPKKVAIGSLKAAKRGRSVYTPRGFFKFYRVLAKILPVKLMVKFAKT